MAPKRKGRPTSPTENRLAEAQKAQETNGADGDEIESSDEIGRNGVPVKRQPTRKAKVPENNAPSNVASPLKQRKADRSPPPRKKGKVVAQVAEPPLTKKAATAAVSDTAKSPPPKKAAVVATTYAANSRRGTKAAASTEFVSTPPAAGLQVETAIVVPLPEAEAPAGAEDLPHVQEGDCVKEKHIKEKSRKYPFLWDIVVTLEQKHSLVLKEAFLKIEDTKSGTLNTKLKQVAVKKIKHHVNWQDIDMAVMNLLLSFIK